MPRRMLPGTLCLAMGLSAGCKEQTAGPEVPKAGPAAVDPGPAPEGQSEPGEEADAATPAADPAADPEVGRLPLPEAGADAFQFVYFEQPATESRSAGAAARDEVKVEILDWKQTEALIAKHKGKVVVVDMWSLSCDPCRREFPNLVALHNEQKDRVACISVSTDYAGIKSKPPEFYKPKVLEFLTQQKATCENVLCSVDSETLFDELALASIPAVYVYGKDGKLAKRFAGEEVHYDKEVVPLVEELLAK
ncbi:MAG: TlpA family protein disulfide reductase [Planctomyces sp.]|nr:TlpA family protein disulfide reductase [Planctomyces sp.]